MSPRYNRSRMSKQQAKKLGDFIRTEREAAGRSLSQLAEAVGVQKSTILRMEHGAIESPSPLTLQQIAEVLGADFEDLFALAGYGTPDGLPAAGPYLRRKYGAMPEEALAEAEAFFAEWEAKHRAEDAEEAE